MNDPDIINRATKPELGYEYRDIDFPKIVKATVWFFIFSVVSVLITIPIYTWMAHGTPNPVTFHDPIRSEAPLPRVPEPNPMVQSGWEARRDIHELRAEENRRMHGVEYTDDSHRTVGIPIDEAMREVARKGLSAPAGGGQHP